MVQVSTATKYRQGSIGSLVYIWPIAKVNQIILTIKTTQNIFTPYSNIPKTNTSDNKATAECLAVLHQDSSSSAGDAIPDAPLEYQKNGQQIL